MSRKIDSDFIPALLAHGITFPDNVSHAADILNTSLWHGSLEWLASQCNEDEDEPYANDLAKVWYSMISGDEYQGPATEAECIALVTEWASDKGTVYVDDDCNSVADRWEDFCYCSEIEEDEDGESQACSYCDGFHSVHEVSIAKAFLPDEVYKHYI